MSSIIYLHAGLKIGSAILYAIHLESNVDSHLLCSQGSHMALGVVRIQTGPTNAKMAKSIVSGDRSG